MPDPLDIIEQRESGGRNIPNYKYGPGFTASGYYQIINATWREWAKAAGIDISQYPTAMSAPRDVQRAVAAQGFKMRGFQPWEAVKHLRGRESNYNIGAAPAASPAAEVAKAITIAELQRRLLEKYPEVRVTSGYRDPAHNARVGGAKNSQHTHGTAIDVSLRGLDEARQREIVEYARSLGARGLGYYPSNQSAHFDVRQGAPAAWGGNYSRTSLPGTPQWFQQIAQQHLKGGGGAPAAPVVASAGTSNVRVPAQVANVTQGALAAVPTPLTPAPLPPPRPPELTPPPALPPVPDDPAPPMLGPPVDYAALMLPRIRHGLLAGGEYDMGLLGAV